MLTFKYLCLLLLMYLLLSGCAVKGYVGSDDLPKTQFATVTFKAPVVSKIPLFWIPPFNMLTWFAEDWFETSWSSGSITVTNLPGTKTTKLWNRFEEILVSPVQQELNSKIIHEINRQITGSESCSTSTFTCTETESKKKDGD